MRRLRRVGFQSYRAHRLAVQDDGAEGRAVTIRAPGGSDEVVLRSAVPSGLPALPEETRRRIDRRLDGEPWRREP